MNEINTIQFNKLAFLILNYVLKWHMHISYFITVSILSIIQSFLMHLRNVLCIKLLETLAQELQFEKVFCCLKSLCIAGNLFYYLFQWGRNFLSIFSLWRAISLPPADVCKKVLWTAKYGGGKSIKEGKTAKNYSPIFM